MVDRAIASFPFEEQMNNTVAAPWCPAKQLNLFTHLYKDSLTKRRGGGGGGVYRLQQKSANNVREVGQKN